MSDSEERTFNLPAEHARFIDGLVASGSYASGNDVVQAALRALQEHDAAVEGWLRDEVIPVYDAMRADPGRGLSADAVFSAIRARHAARPKGAE